MLRRTLLDEKLRARFAPSFLAVDDESARHSVPKDAETHFKVVVVSEAFAEKALVARHRLVYEALGDELRAGLHALSIVARTPDEWAASGGTSVPRSPPCMGGSNSDAPSPARDPDERA